METFERSVLLSTVLPMLTISDASFANPTDNPLEMHYQFGRRCSKDPIDSWDSLATQRVKFLNRFKRKRTEYRQEQMEGRDTPLS